MWQTLLVGFTQDEVDAKKRQDEKLDWKELCTLLGVWLIVIVAVGSFIYFVFSQNSALPT